MKSMSAFSVYQMKAKQSKKDLIKKPPVNSIHDHGKIKKNRKAKKHKISAKLLKEIRKIQTSSVDNHSDEEPPMLVDPQKFALSIPSTSKAKETSKKSASLQNGVPQVQKKIKKKLNILEKSNIKTVNREGSKPILKMDKLVKEHNVKSKREEHKRKRALIGIKNFEAAKAKRSPQLPDFHSAKKASGQLNVKDEVEEDAEFRLSDQEECIEIEDNMNDYNSDDEDAFMNGQRVFGWMIHPTKVNEFFRDVWEKKPLHIPRKEPKYYCHIMNSKALDKMIRENTLHFEKNLDVVTYENGVRETLNPHDGRAMASAIWDFYSNGCSVRIKNPQTFNKKLHILLADLQEFFGSFVGVNLYLTPKDSQGFAPHWDDIEAFVIQLEGRKHWKLYEPKNEKDVLSRYSSHNLSQDELGTKLMEVTLNPGDMLYFPRGVVHQARTDADAHSMHLTISVYQRTSYADLLEHALPAALRKASNEDKQFREGLPLQYLRYLGQVNKDKASELRTYVLEKVKTLMDKLFSSDAVDFGADMMGKRLMQESLPPVPYKAEKYRSSVLDGDTLVNGEVQNRVEFELDTKVRLLRQHCVRLVVDESDPADKVKLYYTSQNSLEYCEDGQKHLSLDPSHIPIIEVLQNNYPKYVPIEEIPVADSQSALNVISDLWELGLIVTKQPLPFSD